MHREGRYLGRAEVNEKGTPLPEGQRDLPSEVDALKTIRVEPLAK